MNSLLHFIRAHGIQAEPAGAGRIRALESFTQHGEAFRRIVIIPATLAAVQSFLGY